MICRFVFVCFGSGLILSPAWAQDDLRLLRAEAIRKATQQVASSIVRVEKFGVAESRGEVADDAPTVAIAIDDQNHFIASSMVNRQSPASLVLVAEDGARSTASVIATDRHRELVLLKSNDDLNVPPVAFDEPSYEVGQTVVAVGRMAGDGSLSVSSGVLSAKDRLWGIALQTDARVSSVFYGGALIDLQGRLMGVLIPAVPDDMGEDSTAWYDSGVAFAIPASAIKERLPTLLKGNDIKPGLLGIVAKSNDPYIESAEIAAVRPRSPAARAEILSGDVVLSIDAAAVQSHRAIKQIIGSKDAGQDILIEIARNDERLSKKITLADSIPPLQPQWVGITVNEVTAAEAPKLKNVVVSGIFDDSPASKLLRVGDAIKSIDGSDVTSADSLRRVVFSADPEKPLKLVIARSNDSGEISEVQVELASADLASTLRPELPDSLLYAAADEAGWKVSDLALPDIGNKGFLAAPTLTDKVKVDGSDLGLVLMLSDPGDTEIEKHAKAWLSIAKTHGVIVCVVASVDNNRWQPDEVDAIARIVASISKRYPVSSLMVAIGGVGAGAGSSMAMAVAISKPDSFTGLAVGAEVTPPAIRLRENDASAPLQMLIRGSTSPDEPSWAAALEKAGYAVFRGNDENETLLRWIRSIPRI